MNSLLIIIKLIKFYGLTLFNTFQAEKKKTDDSNKYPKTNKQRPRGLDAYQVSDMCKNFQINTESLFQEIPYYKKPVPFWNEFSQRLRQRYVTKIEFVKILLLENFHPMHVLLL